MKAKKLIAIGLVAAMTLGMSTSVFAEDSVYPDYTGEPGFGEDYGNWGQLYGPYDDAYHAKGEGWLEGGVGVNESVVNVLVPTTPSINLKRGEPGLFDFGYDNKRLVERTGAMKYSDKENFTKNALAYGVYFIRDTQDFTDEDYDPEIIYNADLNTFDNESVTYSATNIGTETVAFTVTATLSGGKELNYLEEIEYEDTSSVKPSDEIGLFLGLNVAAGTERGEGELPLYDDTTETPFREVDDEEYKSKYPDAVTIPDAEATFTQIVEGVPGNYALKWDAAAGKYRYAMKKSTGTDPRKAFNTVDFWFRGVATNNVKTVIPNDKVIVPPALDFTWSFAKDKDKFPMPKVTAINGEPTTEVPDVFDNSYFDEGVLGLTFDYSIASVEYLDTEAGPDPTWKQLDSVCFTATRKDLTVNEDPLVSVAGGNPLLRVKFEGIGGSYCLLNFHFDL